MPDPTPVPADRLVEIIANAYHWAARNSCGPENCPGVPECIYAEHLSWEGFEAAAAALSEMGALREPEGEKRTEYEIRWARAASSLDRPTVHYDDMDEDQLRARLDAAAGAGYAPEFIRRRVVQTWPNGAQQFGPWEETRHV